MSFPRYGVWSARHNTPRCAKSQERFWKGCKPNFVCPGVPGGENHLSEQPVPGTRSAIRNVEQATPRSPIWPCTRWGFPCLRACAWSGGLLPHLFTLTPLKSLASSQKGGLFSVALSVGTFHNAFARVYPRPNRGYAASRPLVFGLSSLPNQVGRAILRPSKINHNIRPDGSSDNHRRAGVHPVLMVSFAH